jgi:TolB-like protein
MRLYKIDAFEVRSRTSVMQYKTGEKTTPTIGDELKVNYLIEGSWEDILTVQPTISLRDG